MNLKILLGENVSGNILWGICWKANWFFGLSLHLNRRAPGSATGTNGERK